MYSVACNVLCCVVCCMLYIVYCVLCIVYCVLCIQQTHMIDLQPRVRCPRVPQLFAKTFLNSLLTKWLLLTAACYWYPGLISSHCAATFQHSFRTRPSRPLKSCYRQRTMFQWFSNALCRFYQLALFLFTSSGLSSRFH